MSMMRGNNRVRTLVGQYLQAHMPPFIDTYRSEYDDLDENTMPYPSQYLSNDPYDTDQHSFPVIGTYFPSTNNFNQVSLIMDGAAEFTIQYSAVIFLTVRTPILGVDASGNKIFPDQPRAATIKMRDDMMAALRACILSSPSFGTVDLDYKLLADYNSIRESYPEPMRLNEQSKHIWICSGLINIDINSTERVEDPIIGQAQRFAFDIEKLNYDGFWPPDNNGLGEV